MTSSGHVRRRLIQIVPTVAGIVAVAFLLVHAAPGDPVLALAGEYGDADYYAAMRARFGLDRSLPVQFLTYFGRVLQGDFGISYVHGRPAMAVIADRLPASLLLAAAALVVSSIVGIALGVAAGRRAGRPIDFAITASVLTLFAAPVFWLGQIALLTLSLRLGWFPVQGMLTAGSEATGLARLGDIAHHLALPALALASQQLAAVTRLTRAGLVEEMTRDHIRTARGKGLSEHRVVWRHAMRRAALPVVTLIGGRLGYLLGGAAIVEIVFGWPGLGRLLLSSIEARDLPVLFGLFFIAGLSVVLANLATDLFYARLDPRISYD
ncbi:MAG: ABC transporter permease [Gemmatimonadota bacterium]|jgi:peptide/nickel transport system permease protein